MGWIEIWENRGLLLLGFSQTLSLTVVTVVTSTVLGFLVALVRVNRIPVLTPVVRVYLEIFRGSPPLVQILFVYFAAAYLNLTGVTVFLAVVIALTLFEATFISEIFRAGFEAVPLGQREAGRTLGLSRFSVTRDVVLPQTMTIVLPPLFGQYIALVKVTSLASVIGYADIVRQGQGIVDRFGNPFEVFTVVALLYFIISYPMSLIASHLEARTIKKGLGAA
jgi:polar amino acid transport system permease protein